MQAIPLGTSSLTASRLAYGCWRIAGGETPETKAATEAAGREAVIAAHEAGYTLFDTADIYGRGESERLLGRVLREIPGMRDEVVIATKCGIRQRGWERMGTGTSPGTDSARGTIAGSEPVPVLSQPQHGTPTADIPARWDFSAEYIVAACEGSLERLGIETIDLLMLHRPDYLADPEEVARAFDALHLAGKVRYFGVSNFRPSLVTAIQAACPLPLIVHQVEISLAVLDAFTDGTLDQCLLNKMTPMAWSPLAGGLLGSGARRLLPWQENYQTSAINAEVETIARERGTSNVVVALSWLLKHPSRIMPVVGSVQPDRIREMVQATELELSREEWYRLLAAAQGAPLP